MRTLQLTIKSKWFNLILSGKKKEEYREIKKYWIVRLTDGNSLYAWGEDGEFIFNLNKFDAVRFTNGYGKDKPTALFECLGIKTGKGNKELGASEEDVFIIKLGKELDRNNI